MTGRWQCCGLIGRWQNLLCVCSLMLLAVHQCGGITIESVVSSCSHEVGKVIITCGDSNAATLYLRQGSDVTTVVEHLTSSYTTDVNRSTEGFYFCGDMQDNTTEVEIIAFPFPDSNVPRVHNVTLGSTLRMPCTIPFGRVPSKYSVKWYEGLVPINTTSRPHISVDNSNGELVFSSVTAADNGNGYYCEVSVNASGGFFTRQGATISLIVEAPLQLQSGLTKSTGLVGDEARFACSASAVPAPTFIWLVGGVQQDSGISSHTELESGPTITTTSTLTMSRVNVRSTSLTCVALHQRNGVINTASSTADFIVLTNNFNISLIIQEGEVYLRSALSESIPGAFTLAVEYYHSSVNSEESTVFDPSLADSSDIDIKIPRDKLPSGFREFAVRVALKVGDERGPFTSLSNRISLPAGVKSCDCTGNIGSTSSSGLSNTIVIGVVAVFIVLLVVAIVVLVVGCLFLYHRKVNLEKMYDMSHHSSRGSLPRCSSRSSCSSHSSRSSERSYKCSPPSRSGQGSSRSINRNEMELDVIEETGEVQASPYENTKMKQDRVDGPRDVLEYETMDHRVLRQREELRANYMANLDQRAGVPSTRREPEPVFPKTHIGAVNPVPTYRAGHRNGNQERDRDSGSSFEDLEEEFLEFTHKSF